MPVSPEAGDADEGEVFGSGADPAGDLRPRVALGQAAVGGLTVVAAIF